VLATPEGQAHRVFVLKKDQGSAAVITTMKQTMVIVIRNIVVKELN